MYVMHQYTVSVIVIVMWFSTYTLYSACLSVCLSGFVTQ